MSLRADIHDALDVELPRAPALENKVATLIRDESRDRRALVYRSNRSRRLRVPLYMVAAGLIVVLIGGVILGGRYLRDLNAQTQIDPAQLHSLEKTPMRLPTLLSGAQCPITSSSSGPVHIASNGLYSSLSASGIYYWVADLAYDAKPPGIVLIRAVDIGAVAPPPGGQVWFAQVPGATSAVKPVGPVQETDLEPGGNINWYPEAAFNGPVHSGQSLRFLYMLGVAYQVHCVGWQFDGPGFSENLVTGG